MVGFTSLTRVLLAKSCGRCAYLVASCISRAGRRPASARYNSYSNTDALCAKRWLARLSSRKGEGNSCESNWRYPFCRSTESSSSQLQIGVMLWPFYRPRTETEAKLRQRSW